MNNGDITYSSVSINIGICVITDISVPSIPSTSDLSYIIFDVQKTITLMPKFLQVPACGYTLVENIVWTIPAAAPITKTSDPYVITVMSNNGLGHQAVNPVIV